ncbi:uncharacterized protein BDW70DRAFT_136126 [Aspergillus foveolatus]|uniref:uncharacterized protein n=1 Tax=Aspergillus foveolatus TaxID=210207 RepID=UPI003CCD0D93
MTDISRGFHSVSYNILVGQACCSEFQPISIYSTHCSSQHSPNHHHSLHYKPHMLLKSWITDRILRWVSIARGVHIKSFAASPAPNRERRNASRSTTELYKH